MVSLMGIKVLHSYEPLKLESAAINKFKTYVVVHRENTGHGWCC